MMFVMLVKLLNCVTDRNSFDVMVRSDRFKHR